jgi:hypothetical protein
MNSPQQPHEVHLRGLDGVGQSEGPVHALGFHESDSAGSNSPLSARSCAGRGRGRGPRGRSSKLVPAFEVQPPQGFWGRWARFTSPVGARRAVPSHPAPSRHAGPRRPEQVKPHAVCGAFRSYCGGFSRSARLAHPPSSHCPESLRRGPGCNRVSRFETLPAPGVSHPPKHRKPIAHMWIAAARHPVRQAVPVLPCGDAEGAGEFGPHAAAGRRLDIPGRDGCGAVRC